MQKKASRVESTKYTNTLLNMKKHQNLNNKKFNIYFI